MSMSSPAAMQVSATLDLSQYESRSRTLVATTQKMAANVNTAMAGISRSVAGSGTAFDRLRASLDPAFAASQRYRQIQQDLAAMVERGDATQRAANIALEQAASRYMGVATAAERAEQVQREQAAAVALSTGQYEALRASLDPVYASSKRYEAAEQAMTAAVKTGAITRDQANQVLEQAASRYMGVATAAERAEQVQREQAAAIAQSTGQYEALRASLDPVYASSKRYEAAQQSMAAAVKTGAITQAQANQVLDMAAQKMLGIAPATKAAASATAAAGTASKGLFASVGGGQNAMKQFSFQLNQVAQQGAVTGNYMQALSIQAADMLTVFGLWGILAGGAIAVLGPLAMNLIGADNGGKQLKKTMDDLRDATDAYRSAAADAAMSSADLIEKFGRYSGAARETYAVLRDLAQLDALDKLQASITAISEMDVASDIKAFAEQYEFYGKYAGDALEKLSRRFQLTGEGAIALTQRIQAIGAADGPEEAAKATAELNEWLKKVYGTTENIPTQLRELARQAANGNLSAQTILATMNGVTAATYDAASAAATLAARLGAAATSDAAAARDRLQVIQAQISAINAGQDEVVAGRQRQLDLEREAYRNAQLAAGVDAGIVANAERALFSDRQSVIYAEQDLQLKIKARNEAEKTASASARASDRLARKYERELEALRASLDPLEAYRQKLAKLVPLQAALSQDEFARAIRALNVELADSLPLVGDLSDAISTGLVDGFEGGLSSMTDALKSWLKQAIALAMKNQIVVGLGLNGSVSAGGTAAAAAAGGAMSGIGTAFSALSLGMSNFAGSIMSSAWGSISGAFSAGLAGLSTSVTTAFANLTGNVGALLSGTGGSIASSLGALGSAIGAIAGPVAIIAGLVSFFGTKTKLLDAGIKAVITDTDVLVSTYKRVKKTRFWGLSSSTSTSTKPASAEVADPITRAINATQASILSMASVLGIATETFDAFAYELKVSTKGLSDEEIGKALAAAMSDAADAYALMIGGLDELIATGETATEALTRLSTALTTVNGAFDTLGYALRYSGLAGAAVSSALEDLLGGADGFTSAVSTYWGTFYSAAEQQAILTRQATTALAAYNAALPRSREEYRALIDAQDLTTEAGRALWAELVGMAGVMDQILPAVSGLTAELETLLGAVSTSLDATINAVTESQKAAAAAAGQWYKAADSIAEFIRTMRSTSGALVSPTQATAFSQAQYQTRLASALAGDLDAVNGLTGVAQTYLDAVGATAGSATELALAQARVLSDLGTVQGASQIEGARWDVIQGLYQDQVDLMQEVADTLAAGNALSEAQIATLNAQLGSLDDAIAAAAAINYASLQKQIDLSITAVEDAQIPDYLKALLRNADTGITSTIDFITRSDLTPDLKWLALTGASEMVKTVTYAAENDLGADLTRLAVDTVSTLRKTVHLLAGAGLDAETMQVALAGNSELARVVTATLATDIDAQAKRLALGTVGAYGVSVMASLSPGVSADVRRIVIDEQGSYAALIEATLGADLSADARRILLSQQGRYVANITGVLVSDMDAATRALLLSANTSAARAITLATVYAGSLTAAEIALLRTQATTASATIRAAIDLAGVSATGLLYLAQIGMGSTAVQKTLTGTIALSALSEEARLLLSAVSETVQKSVAFRATGGATEDQLRLLGAVSATVLRAVNITATGSLTAAQAAMLGASSGTVQRLLALAATGTLSADQKTILATAAATVTRALILSTTGGLTSDQRAVLLAETANISRGLALTATGALSTDQRSMLAAVSATVTRQLALAAGGALTTDQRSMLLASSGSVARALALTASGALTGDQRSMILADSASISRALALSASGTLTTDQRTMLLSGTAYIARVLAMAAIGTLSTDQRSMLLANSASVSRVIALTAGGALTTDQRSMLLASSGSAARALALSASGTLTTDQRSMLQSGTAYIARVIAMQARGVLTDDQRRILTATTGTVERTVNGLVNLSGLTAQQRVFLGAISGSTSGTLTLGGSFRFDPTAAFSTWYEATTEASIAAPMTALRGALGDLAAAVRAETARAAHETAVTGLNTYAAGMTKNPLGAYFVTDADLAAMAGIIGLDTTGQTALQLRRAIAGYDAADLLSSTIYDPTGNLEAAYLASVAPQDSTPAPASYALSDYRLQRVSPFAFLVTGPLGGRRLFSAATEDLVKDQIASQGFPAFARGGTHDGGPAYIGENDLELVAPSRIYNPSETRSMLDNRQVVEELRALREELRALKDESRQLGLQTADNTRSIAKVTRKWDVTGMPKETTA